MAVTGATSGSIMVYEISVQDGIVVAVLTGRETAQQTKEFLRDVASYSPAHAAFLIRVRASKPVFQLAQYGLTESLHGVAPSPSHRIALLADTLDLQVSHEYLELIARQHALNVRSFRDAAAALRWLKEPRAEPA